ncbi:FirrV-1-A41 [Feldmannia irregularis virus a]|uniref:FirrV-1-A41 n=1 Tax=Feldmannia irregularis virus a TaxID=231992 RepID=Q6XM46_9PHYC|nr:FirrV-1-A41 [Feldmannia irregularis virus a]AAR26865.1 FirrV-1-A41 [Feldmannia irregularis virus a]
MTNYSFLCGAVEEWQQHRIRDLLDNTLQYPDMAWKLNGEDDSIRDCRVFYECSTFLTNYFQTSVGTAKTNADGLPLYTLSEKPAIFSMIRIFCHTGLMCFDKTDSILTTMERYAAFQFYGIEMGSATLKRHVLESLTPSNSVLAFEYAVHRHDDSLLAEIKAYMSHYAFIVFRQKSFLGIGKESFHQLVSLCDSDNLNMKEIDLFSCLFRLCEKKNSEKGFAEFDSAFSIMTHTRSQGEKSLYDTLRLHSITMEEVMSFVHKHPAALNNDQIVQIMREIHQPGDRPKRKKFQAVSSYPRYLNFNAVVGNPQVDVSHRQTGKMMAHFVFPFTPGRTKSDVALPPIAFGAYQVHANMVYTDRTIGITGQIHATEGTGINSSSSSSSNSSSNTKIRVVCYIINFRHERWKKSSVCLDVSNTLYQYLDFRIPNILSCNAIERSCGTPTGYLFDVTCYPEYSEQDAASLLLSMECEEIHQDAASEQHTPTTRR